MEVKKKRVSKKKKISWRKHVNIQDVDDFLEDKRLDERLGKLDTLTNDELFTLDTKAPDETSLTAKQKKILRILAPPKCFSMLRSHSKVPDPIAKRNHVRTKQERMCPIVKRKEEERKLKGILKAKELQSLKDKRKYELAKVSKSNEVNEDIWSVDECDVIGINNCEWLDKVTKRHNLKGLGRVKKTAPRPLNKKSATPGVEPPHPGTSYNPSFDDHQKLLRDIAEKEVKIIKDEEHINRVTRDMFRKVTVDAKESSWLIEMSEGLPKAEDQVEDADDGVYKSINPAVVNKKKTLKQRRKQKEQTKIQETRRIKRMEKKKTVDIHKLRLIAAAIEKREKELRAVQEKRLKIAALLENEPKRLSKLKYEEPDVEFNLAKDIAGNLRNVKKEGDVLADRFRSMQKRNILEVTTKQIRKKAKVKRFKRSGFADKWKTTVAKCN